MYYSIVEITKTPNNPAISSILLILLGLFFELVGAGRGGRTPTTLRSADFESAASASSAIPAWGGYLLQKVLHSLGGCATSTSSAVSLSCCSTATGSSCSVAHSLDVLESCSGPVRRVAGDDDWRRPTSPMHCTCMPRAQTADEHPLSTSAMAFGFVAPMRQ